MNSVDVAFGGLSPRANVVAPDKGFVHFSIRLFSNPGNVTYGDGNREPVWANSKLTRFASKRCVIALTFLNSKLLSRFCTIS